jgi:hypothetical protein
VRLLATNGKTYTVDYLDEENNNIDLIDTEEDLTFDQVEAIIYCNKIQFPELLKLITNNINLNSSGLGGLEGESNTLNFDLYDAIMNHESLGVNIPIKGISFIPRNKDCTIVLNNGTDITVLRDMIYNIDKAVVTNFKIKEEGVQFLTSYIY